MSRIEDVIDLYWKKLKKRKGVLSIKSGMKFKDGKNTGESCITIYVVKKIDEKLLSLRQKIPKKIKGIKTDVVELSTEDFKMGETNVSKKSPKQQKRIAGGVQNE